MGPTWFLIVALSAWALLALVAALAGPHASSPEERGEPVLGGPRKAPRRFIAVARVPRSPGLRAYALRPEGDPASITQSA